jgi:hypothetical protein
MDLSDWRARLRSLFGPLAERDHIVILNWSATGPDLVRALVDPPGRNERIVVLADVEPQTITGDIARAAGDAGTVRTLVRRGETGDAASIGAVFPETARAIIVLSPPGEEPDSRVVKTVLALVKDPTRKSGRYRIVAELRDAANADLLAAVGGNEVQAVHPDDLVARMMVQTARQPGLAAVFHELLDFTGPEIHTVEQPELSGNAFGDALMAYESATLIGIADGNGRAMLNPPADTVLTDAMRAIVIADGVDAIRIAAESISVDGTAISLVRPGPRVPERTLILGWNRRAPTIARELALYVMPGSVLTVAANLPDLLERAGKVGLPNDHMTLECAIVDTTSRTVLESLNLMSYDHVLVLGDADAAPGERDTRALMALLQLRRIAETADVHINIVGEVTDMRSGLLAETARADELIVANRVTSLMLAQAARNDALTGVFADLLGEAGSEIYLKPASHYVEPGRAVNFYTIVEAARRKGEIAIGYIREDEADPGGGPVINPRKTAMVSYGSDDRIVVIAKE